MEQRLRTLHPLQAITPSGRNLHLDLFHMQGITNDGGTGNRKRFRKRGRIDLESGDQGFHLGMHTIRPES